MHSEDGDKCPERDSENHWACDYLLLVVVGALCAWKKLLQSCNAGAVQVREPDPAPESCDQAAQMQRGDCGSPAASLHASAAVCCQGRSSPETPQQHQYTASTV